MNKFIGYIIALIGLALIGLSPAIAKIPGLSSIPGKYLIIGGIVIIIIGIALTLQKHSSNVKQAAEEVPIYSGEGKNRKIVGYRKAEK